MSDNTFDNFDDLGEIDFEPIAMSKIIDNLPNCSSQKLCEIIVCDRYLGLNAKLSEACMQELASRRSMGDTFDFEGYIETSTQDMPRLDFDLPDIRSVLHQIIKQK